MNTRICSMIQPAQLIASKNIINTILRRLFFFFFPTFDLKVATAVKHEYSWTWLAMEAQVIFLLNAS